MLLKSEIETAYHIQQDKKGISFKETERELTQTIDRDNSYVQVISGVRRSGKSTLLKILMKKYRHTAYLNFEDPRLLNFEVGDFTKFDEIIPETIEAFFFDEIQNISKWEIYVRQLHDSNKKVFITGSNASLLSKELGTRLTGRYLAAELFPFSYTEFLNFSNKRDNAETFGLYLKHGGFPEYLKTQNTESLQNLLKDIVLRDIAIRYGIRNTKTLLELTLYLISNIGKEISYNNLKKVFGIGSANTVMDYLSWLEDAYLVFFLKKFSWSAKSMAINPRKVYVIDTGLAQANSLSFSSDSGRLFENTVFIFLKTRGIKMYYFRDKHECDLVLFHQNKCLLSIQVCYQLTPDNKQRELSGLLEALTFFHLKKGYIVTFDQEDVLTVNGYEIKLLPARKIITCKTLEELLQF